MFYRRNHEPPATPQSQPDQPLPFDVLDDFDSVSEEENTSSVDAFTPPVEEATPVTSMATPQADPALPADLPEPTPFVAAPPTASDVAPRARPAESVIGPDDFFDGNYRSERGVRIQGNARGSIESRQYIYVEEGAQVEATLAAEDITIAGSFNGTIECRNRMEVAGSGVVQGRIQTARLVVHDGGMMDGELHMRRDTPAGSPSPE